MKSWKGLTLRRALPSRPSHAATLCTTGSKRRNTILANRLVDKAWMYSKLFLLGFLPSVRFTLSWYAAVTQHKKSCARSTRAVTSSWLAVLYASASASKCTVHPRARSISTTAPTRSCVRRRSRSRPHAKLTYTSVNVA